MTGLLKPAPEPKVNGSAVLTVEDVRAIRRRAEGTGLDSMPVIIAQEYQVTPMTVYNILRRKTWRWVE